MTAYELRGYLDVSALFAIFVYALLAFLLGQLVDWTELRARSIRG